MELTIGPGVGKRERLQCKGKEYMQEVWDVSHNVPHRSRVEAPWVMPPRRNGEPGKGREELADITCRDWTDAQGGANGTGGSAKETTVQQLDARKCSMSLHAQGITK